MIKVNTEILTTLHHRFDEQVSESDILNWLYNFAEEDWSMALTLLNNVSFYSESRIAGILEDGLTHIIGQHREMPVAIYPIGGIGKSGGVMAYLIKKLMGRFRDSHWAFADDDFSYKKKPYTIILLDDFIGSGGSACKLYDSIAASIPRDSIVVCLCVAYMQKAAIRLSEKGVKIIGEEHLPAFVRRRSVFGYPPRMKVIREFAIKYGEILYPHKKYVEGMDLYIGPLGYANCQSLVCFTHTTPNNTLPILWASNIRKDNGKKWTPLFPRHLFDRMSQDSSFERMKYKWISIAQKISKGAINHPFNDFSKTSIQLIGLLHGKFHKRSDTYICTMLEITHTEYYKLCAYAKDQKLLIDENLLSPEGLKAYTSIRKNEFKEKSLIEEKIDKSSYIYLPQKFLGFFRV